MPAQTDRLEFAPPPQPGLLKAVVLALLAHLLLLLALTTGLQWKRESQDLAVEAELWASVPQEAAPRQVEVTPAAPPPPAPVPQLPGPQVAQREAEIALEQERRKQAEEERRAEEAEEREKQRQLAARRKRDEEARAQALRQQEAQKLAAADRKRKEEAEKVRREEAEARRVAQLREENLRRMQGMAGGTGAPSSTGTAAQSSGPSASWAGRVRARVRPNIVFTDDVAGNPKAEVEVRLAPDGTIVGQRVVKSSGVRSWDQAVLRALDRTEMLPRDVDGRVPALVILEFRPRD